MNKRRILCFGDSNTWGYVPRTDDIEERYPSGVRWTGRLQLLGGNEIEIIEEGLNSRTTAIENPDRPGRNGLQYLGPCLESQNPIDLVILMLGTNDIVPKYHSSAEQILERIKLLVQKIQELGQTQAHTPCKILLVAPPEPLFEFAYEKFRDPDLVTKLRTLSALMKDFALQENIPFLNLANEIQSSEVDGVHLSSEMHEKLAHLIWKKISP